MFSNVTNPNACTFRNNDPTIAPSGSTATNPTTNTHTNVTTSTESPVNRTPATANGTSTPRTAKAARLTTRPVR
ncbi:hypothetical protein GCM10029964_047700 [Kibdelosporangium lantanae]